MFKGSAAFGLMHCCYELYGGPVVATLLSALGRLFTGFFQLTGLSLGIEDLLLTSYVCKRPENKFSFLTLINILSTSSFLIVLPISFKN